MNGEINGVFIYNGKPQNGALAKLWKITGFASYADSTDKVQDNPLTATSIELNVSDGTLFAVGDVIQIDTELMRIFYISTNKLYVIRDYRGSTAAAHAQAAGQPTEAKYDDNGAISDLPLAIDNAPGTEENFVGFVAADDHIYVAGAAKFGGLTIDIGTTPNAVGSVLTVECSDGGTGWLACTLLDDGTDAIGASMAVDGVITFTPHVDWASDTVDGDTGFWVRLTWSGNWTAGTDIAEIDLTMLTTINDETITEPAQDTAEPTAGYQHPGDVTTAVAYGGDGAYRWTAVPEGEYYVSVYYDAHRAWLYASVETNDPTPEQLLRADGDTMIRNADGVVRLPGGANGQFLQMDANRPIWSAVGGLTKEFFIPAVGTVNAIDIDAIGKHPGMLLDDVNAEGSVGFYVPNDWGAITDAVLVCVWDALHNNTDLDIYTEYGAVGQAYNTHSDSDEATTYNFAADEITEIDVSGLLGAIAIGDHVGVSLKLSTDPGNSLYLLGLRFRYS